MLEHEIFCSLPILLSICGGRWLVMGVGMVFILKMLWI